MSATTPFRTISILSLLADVKSPDGIHLQRLKERLLAEDPGCEGSISTTLTALKKKGYTNNPLISMWAITEAGIEHLIELQAREKERKEREAAEAAAAAEATVAAIIARGAGHGAAGQPAPVSAADLDAAIAKLTSDLSQQIDRKIGSISHDIGRQLADGRATLAAAHLEAIREPYSMHEARLAAISKAVEGMVESIRFIRATVELLADRQAELSGKLDHVAAMKIAEKVVQPLAAKDPAPPQPTQPKQPIKASSEPAPKKGVTVRKPSILVIGLLNQQMQRVNKRYSRFADLAFIDSQKANVHEIKAACSGRDHILQMTAFTGHSTDDAVKCATGKPPTRVTGSVSSLFREIDQIIVQHHTAK